ncbi:MAG: nucleotidyltransferase domain-containing protein, partial [Peptococcaceae bacterium]
MSNTVAAQAVIRREKRLSEIFQQHGVELAFLFGSATDQKMRSTRDIDIAVLFSSYDFNRYLKTLSALTRIIKLKNVDLAVLNLAHPALKMEALLKGVLLYCASLDTFAWFGMEAFFDYSDYLFFKKEFRYHLQKRSREGLS